jgi:hypothetical protein
MNLIVPLFLIIASVGIFYGYTDPNYRGENGSTPNVVKLMNERKQYLEALSKSDEFIKETNRLTLINNSLSYTDLDRLKKILPDHIDNVRLIIDIDNIASRHGLHIKGIKIDNDAGSAPSDATLGPDNKPYGSIMFSFNITAPYDRFRSFIKDLEESLRIADIVGVSFTATDSGDYDYGVKLKTYWIK